MARRRRCKTCLHTLEHKSRGESNIHERAIRYSCGSTCGHFGRVATARASRKLSLSFLPLSLSLSSLLSRLHDDADEENDDGDGDDDGDDDNDDLLESGVCGAMPL